MPSGVENGYSDFGCIFGLWAIMQILSATMWAIDRAEWWLGLSPTFIAIVWAILAIAKEKALSWIDLQIEKREADQHQKGDSK